MAFKGNAIQDCGGWAFEDPERSAGRSLGLHADINTDFRVNSLRAEDGAYSALQSCEETERAYGVLFWFNVTLAEFIFVFSFKSK